MIASSLPLVPKSFQLFLGQRTSRSNRKYDPSLTYSNPRRFGKDSNDRLKGPRSDGFGSWDDHSGFNTQPNKTYIPLDEINAQHGTSVKVSGGHGHHHDWDPDEFVGPEIHGNSNGITKTIRVESQLSKLRS